MAVCSALYVMHVCMNLCLAISRSCSITWSTVIMSASLKHASDLGKYLNDDRFQCWHSSISFVCCKHVKYCDTDIMSVSKTTYVNGNIENSRYHKR